MTTTLHILLILSIILVVPILFRKVGLPSIVGLIIAGIAIGPYGFGIVERQGTIKLLSNLGLYYIMFTSGIEIDINDFKRNSRKTITFGSLSFLIPFLFGLAISCYVLHFNIPSGLLLAAMFASHTLMTYPIVSRYGIERNSVVGVAVGGTMIAVTLSLLLIAAVSSYLNTHVLTASQGWMTALFSLLFIVSLLWLFPRLAHIVFRQTNDSIAQFIFVMLMVIGSVALSQAAGLEGILGAFLAGLTLNRLIPNLSPLMNKISFVGNAIFIPVFLISVGMLVDVSAFTQGWNTWYIAIVMCLTAVLTKWLAAWLTQRICHYTEDEGNLLFGLSGAKAAVSLAAVMIGYNIIDSQGQHLLNTDVLNGTIVMILVTCTVSSIITERAAKRISTEKDSLPSSDTSELSQRHTLLLPLANPDHAPSLLNLAFLCADPYQGAGISALRVVKTSDRLPQAERELNNAARLAAEAKQKMSCYTQVAANVANGISEVSNRLEAKEIIIGTNVTEVQLEDINMMRDGKRLITYGNVINQLISNQSQQISIYKAAQPINTIKRLIVAIPQDAERESGFMQWFERIRQIASQLGCTTVFHSSAPTQTLLQTLAARPKKELTAEYCELDAWEDFLLIAKEIRPNDMLIVIQARKSTASYNPLFAKMPYMLYRFFKENSWLVIYPEQQGTANQLNRLI